MHQRRRIILLFGAGIVLPSLLLGYLAFRGIQNDRALLEKERLEETRQAAERVLQAVDEKMTAVETALSKAGWALLFNSWDPLLDNVLLKTMPVGGGEPRDLHKFDGATSMGPMVWTPDGKSILSAVTIGKDPKSLWRVSADTGEAENLGLAMKINRMSIYPDGRQIAISSPGPVPQKPELWVMENFLPIKK